MRIAIASLLLAAATACSSRTEEQAPGSAPAVSIPVKAASSSSKADVREMNAYRLNMDDIRKWAAITKKGEGMNLAKGDAGPEASIDQFETALDADPKARALIEAGGLDTHEYAVITMTMVQGALIQMAMAQGANGDSIARSTGITLDNVRFLHEHEKEIAALTSK